MVKRLSIKFSKDAALTITRHALKREKLVYVAVANRAQKYPRDRSPIVYIGTTKNGVGRVAASAAGQARKLLLAHGVKQLHLFVVSCTALRGVETWKKLESGSSRLKIFTGLYRLETLKARIETGETSVHISAKLV